MLGVPYTSVIIILGEHEFRVLWWDQWLFFLYFTPTTQQQELGFQRAISGHSKKQSPEKKAQGLQGNMSPSQSLLSVGHFPDTLLWAPQGGSTCFNVLPSPSIDTPQGWLPTFAHFPNSFKPSFSYNKLKIFFKVV